MRFLSVAMATVFGALTVFFTIYSYAAIRYFFTIWQDKDILCRNVLICFFSTVLAIISFFASIKYFKESRPKNWR